MFQNGPKFAFLTILHAEFNKFEFILDSMTVKNIKTFHGSVGSDILTADSCVAFFEIEF